MPLEPALAYSGPDAGLFPTQPPLPLPSLRHHPIWEKDGCLTRLGGHSQPKAEAGTGCSGRGPSPFGLTSHHPIYPMLGCGLPLNTEATVHGKRGQS